jgi:hypothetical protein
LAISAFNAAKSTFNIITTNKNKTATAPTYIIISNIAKNSAPNNINNPAELKKAKISQRTECTGWRERVTNTAEQIETIAKR